MNTPVLIVGAGPTGLTLAAQLARHHIPFRLIEKMNAPSDKSRALVVHARTLELFEDMGIAHEAIIRGQRSQAFHVLVDGEEEGHLDLDALGSDLTPFPFLLVIGQDQTEALLREYLGKMGGTIEWGTELLSLRQDDEKVTVRLRKADGSEEDTTVSWVAGCDGAKSTVRQLLGLPFKGDTYEQRFYLIDTALEGELSHSEFYLGISDDGIAGIFPMKGKNRFRIFGVVPEDLKDREELTREEIQDILLRVVRRQFRLYDEKWTSTYQLHHRCVPHFRTRRCFVLGDAAHIHSPAGGQGMNTGIQDACNLVWKLAMVIKKQAPEILLDSYHDERYPVAKMILRTTDRAFTFMVSKNPILNFSRKYLFPPVADWVTHHAAARKEMFRRVSQLAFTYRRSPIVAEYRKNHGFHKEAPRAGDRAPYGWVSDRAGKVTGLFSLLGGTHHHLLLMGGLHDKGEDIAADLKELFRGELFEDMVKLHVIPQDTLENHKLAERYGVERPALFLVRPDGHIAYRSQPADVAHFVDYWSRLRGV